MLIRLRRWSWGWAAWPSLWASSRTTFATASCTTAPSGAQRRLRSFISLGSAGDRQFGLFGSRSDTNDSHEARGTDKFLGLAVRHGTGLALVYTATLAAWLWVIFDALAEALARADWNASWQPAEWLLADRHAHFQVPQKVW